MAVFNNILAGASGATGAAAGYQVERSLRFDDASNGHLRRTPSTAGNRKTWTLSFWIKRTEIGGTQYIFNAGNTSNGDHSVMRINNDQFQMYQYGHGGDTTAWSGGNGSQLRLDAVFRDPSAWMHIVVAMDTTQATQSDRLKYYVNGVEQTDFSSTSYPVQNSNPGYWNAADMHCIGGIVQNTNPSGQSDYYLAEVHFVDGTQLAASDFGEYDDNNVWQAKSYSGTYGTNGFHLDFSDNSSNAALGYDAAGSNDWTVNNFAVTGFGWPSTTWSDDISIDSGNYYLNNNDGPNGFDGNSTTYIDCRLGTGSNSTTNIIWEPTGGISGVTKIRVHSNYATHYRINEGTWTTFNSQGSYTQIYSGSAFTLTKLEIRRNDNSGSDYGHRVTAYELNGIEVRDNLAQSGDQSGIDSLIDTPTNYTADSGNNGGNYAVLNPLAKGAAHTLSNGNLDFTMPIAGGSKTTPATMGVSSGKWYWEMNVTTVVSYYPGIGIDSNPDPTGQSGDTATGRMYLQNGQKFSNATLTNYGANYAAGDVIAAALDMDGGTITFYKNGVSQGQAFSGITGTQFPVLVGHNGAAGSFNFGQRPFAYTPPTNHLALVTSNLSDPTIADGSTVMDAVTYTGTGSSQSITTSFSPDLVWIKSRSIATGHSLFDTIRGALERLQSDSTAAEATANGTLTSFDTDGFTLGTGTLTNQSSASQVAWAWDAGSSTVSNTDGSVTSSVRASQTNGFSIVSYTAPSSGTFTVGHGLNAAPGLIISKHTNRSSDWYVWNSSFDDEDDYINLNSTSAKGSATDFWGTSAPGSSTFGGKIGTSHTAGDTDIAYCFAPVSQYSAFGVYTGNGSDDGSFVFLNFRPAFLIIKRVDAIKGWMMIDSTRNPSNVIQGTLYPHLSDAEFTGTGHEVDFLSNGFKCRKNNDRHNASGGTYLYAAFAEHPFKTARAR